MGEIGINRIEYLYILTYSDILLIERGYYRRSMSMWSAVRWQTYNVMAAQIGSKGLSESGINSPSDLIKFPWEDDLSTDVDEDYVREMRALIDSINEENEKGDG